MSVAINGTNGITYNDGSLQPSAPVGRNLIINGDMAIDQRNAGASATSNATIYMTDRFQFQMSSVTNVQTYQQVTDAPAGFNNSLKITNNSTTQATAAGVLSTPRQKIEGLNTAYLNWGTSDAQTVTISFWVKASVTGTYPVSLINNDFTRSFVTNYTVSVANTWEKKTATIAGDTSGTWTVDNSTGISVMFSLDTGSTYQTTAGSWQTGNYRGTSSDVHFLANASATWQITGLQLEASTTATPFENLQYGQQLALCQRYYEQINTRGTGSETLGVGIVQSSTSARFYIKYSQVKRAEPTISSTSDFTKFLTQSGSATNQPTGFSSGGGNLQSCYVFFTISGHTVGQGIMLLGRNTGVASLKIESEL